MAIQHPEFSEKYPAIDGIEKDTKREIDSLRKQFPESDIPYKEPEKAIRSDIEKILALNDEEFHKWFSERKITAQKLLNNYELVGSIPDLIYASEDQKNGLTANVYLGEPIKILKKGIEYLEVIKKVRDEQK